MIPFASKVFDPEPASVTSARAWVAGVVREWATELPISTELVDAVRLVTSELVGNAVRHAGTRIRATLRIEPGDALRLEVEDGSASPVRRPEAGTRSLDGRGLALVERLADHWGSDDLRNGKVIWARWAVPGFPGHPDGDS